MQRNQPEQGGGGETSSGVQPQDVDMEDEPSSQLDQEPESSSSGEDFLFHLYRGSELLQDNCIGEAKEELERALAMQPQDVEGQGLLGIVYFRLGLYPRAIKIYEEIVRACPTELTPRVNLALCYIKTGQLGRARRELETVISHAPERKRAWGYLGLVFERMGDLHKARAAFEKAAQEHLVRRMDRLLGEEQTRARESDRPERVELRQAAADAVAELETAGGATSAFLGAAEAVAGPRSGRWRATEPGEEAIPPPARSVLRDPQRPRRSLPPLSLTPPARPGAVRSAGDLANESLLAFPTEPGLSQPHERCVLVNVAEAFCVRQDRIAALLPQSEPFSCSALMRRHRGRETTEPMGGHAAPFLSLAGRGQLMITTRRAAEILDIKRGFVYLRETALVGFTATVRYEHGRLSAPGFEAVSVVQLSGSGEVVFERRGALKALAVRAEQPTTLAAELVLGWTGRLLSGPVESAVAPNQGHGFVGFTGDGAVFLEMPDGA